MPRKERSKVKTGIIGLDKMLNGGLVESTVTLVAGSPGIGKTTLGLQFIYNGVKKYNENGLVVTFEELPDQIYKDAEAFGWDIRKMEEAGKVRVMSTSPFVLQQMRIYKNQLDKIISELKVKRVLIDSITLFKSLVKNPIDLRKEIYSLINYFKAKGITVIFTHELPKLRGGELSISDFGLGFLVDSIILLRYVEIGSELKKSITIVKLRGSNHDKAIRELTIGPKGVEIELPFSDYENVMGGSAFKSVRKEVDKFFNK
jgi:circadian clock protein KaiC